MPSIDLQGDLDLLSEKQISFICDVLEKHGFEESKVLVETLGKAEDNFASNMRIITAVRKDEKKLKIIAKIAPTSENMRTASDVQTLFRNEFLMYGKVLPKFCQLQNYADTLEENKIKFPVCYGILDEPPHEIILLEDLRESNYVMRDKFKSLSDEEIRVVLNTIAKFHSLSFILKIRDPVTYETYISKLTDIFTTPQMEENVKNGFHLVETNIMSLCETKRYKDKIRGCLSKFTDEAHKLKLCDAESKYGVIVHGDSWTNNILFKGKNNVPEDIVLIDYQMSCERSPVSDLLYLVLNCTDYDTRSKHYDEWMDEYHEKLDRYLSNHGIKADYVYPREKMLADLKRYSRAFLGWSIIVTHLLCMDTEVAAQHKKGMDSSDNIEEMMQNFQANVMENKLQILMKAREFKKLSILTMN